MTKFVRSLMRSVAVVVDKLSGGRVSPTHVTLVGALAHVPIAMLIASDRMALAAILLVIFGLFDTLDGELARLQRRASDLGMLLDSFLDRIKEVLIYCGVAALLIKTAPDLSVVVSVAALGVSLCTSYLNAWGDAVVNQAKGVGRGIEHSANSSFRGGILGFERRILLIALGLLFGQIELVIYAILLLSIVTILQRYMNIARKLA